jgi:DNA-3-methyladenine glycosylase II
MYFKYGNEETTFLKNKDRLLGLAIDRIGHIQREIDSDLFSSVVRHIIGQQISTKAQETIWQRLVEKVGIINEKAISRLDLNELQKVGLIQTQKGSTTAFQ